MPLACAPRQPVPLVSSAAPQSTVPPCQGSTLTEDPHCPAQVGAWGNCSQPCGTGVANRSVICIDSGGATLNSTLCPGLQPEHQAYCLNKECDFCSTTDCSKQVSTGHALLPQAAIPEQHIKQNMLWRAHSWQHRSRNACLCSPLQKDCCLQVQGECRNNVCVCTPGYRGDYCEINPSCSGLLDVNGNCCPDGVVSATGVCCGDVSPPCRCSCSPALKLRPCRLTGAPEPSAAAIVAAQH